LLLLGAPLVSLGQTDYATPYTFGTLAGIAGISGTNDGTGSEAQFHIPEGVAVDGAGNVYVSERLNNTIRKITPLGVVTTLAGLAGTRGTNDGTGSAARFSFPHALTADGAGNVYVADSGNDTIRKVTPAGVVTTLAGNALGQGSTDGTGSAALFDGPADVAVDALGNVYVADTANNTIRKVTPVGVVTTLAGSAGVYGSDYGNVDGTGSAARFHSPGDISVDSSGNVYVADVFNNAIRKVTPAGVVSTVVGSCSPTPFGNFPGPLPASLLLPRGIAVNQTTGSLYIALSDAVLVASTPSGTW
jgi:hypothetical protein